MRKANWQMKIIFFLCFLLYIFLMWLVPYITDGFAGIVIFHLMIGVSFLVSACIVWLLTTAEIVERDKT